jgi:pyrroloquinoline-quinone synthase
MICPSCFKDLPFERLAQHFSEFCRKSDAAHIMWLNRNITKNRESEMDLSAMLDSFFDVKGIGLKRWMKRKFIDKFYGTRPHPFVLALQHPSKAVLIGYVLEHQHFLKQWVRSLSWILAKTDRDDVVKEELDNIITEFYGYGSDKPSHYELLIRMGVSLGLERRKILDSIPLHDTAEALQTWQDIGEKRHWVETMAAMHSLELIANRDIRKDGAVMTYFDPTILKGEEITKETQAFLFEGYEADVEHSEVPLELVEGYATKFGNSYDVQVTFLRSVEAFDSYLMARLERGMQYDPSLVRYVVTGEAK